MNSLTTEEEKIVGLMKCWVKISTSTGIDGGLHNAFIGDWEKLQHSIFDRTKDVEECKKIITEVEKEMEQYINSLY